MRRVERVKNRNEGEQLVSRLLSAPKVTSEERAVIAEIADRGVFDDARFVERCVRSGEPAYVKWRAVRDWARDKSETEREWASSLAMNGIEAQNYDETNTPADLAHLQVVLDLDQPKGWIVAAWRDIFADHGQSDEVDLCLEFLTDRRLCWDCGDFGVAERDLLFRCVNHRHNKEKN